MIMNTAAARSFREVEEGMRCGMPERWMTRYKAECPELFPPDERGSALRPRAKRGAMEQLYECRQCDLEGRPYHLPPVCFGVDEPSQIAQKILREGSWARCLPCQEVARTLRAARGIHVVPASLQHGFQGEDDVESL